MRLFLLIRIFINYKRFIFRKPVPGVSSLNKIMLINRNIFYSVNSVQIYIQDIYLAVYTLAVYTLVIFVIS